MKDLFKKMLRDDKWTTSIEDNKLTNFFTEYKSLFPFYGGDIKVYLDKIKVIHSRKRVILDRSMWKIISEDDLFEGFDLFRKGKEETDKSYLNMFL